MRLFIAIQFSQSILDALTSLQLQWKSLGMRGHHVSPENLHLTLAFIGEYGKPEHVMDVMESISFHPFSIHLDGVGNFRDLCWAGIANNEELSRCVRCLRKALADDGIPFDRKRFFPHVTLVRKAQFQGSMELLTKYAPVGEMEVDSISLMSSTRGKNGMIYTKIGQLDAAK